MTVATQLPPVRPERALDRTTNKALALTIDAVVSSLVEFFLNHYVSAPPIAASPPGTPSVGPIIDLTLALGILVVIAAVGVASYLIWRPIDKVRESNLRLHIVLTNVESRMKTDAESHKKRDGTPMTKFEDVEEVVIGRTLCRKLLVGFDDAKETGETTTILLLVAIASLALSPFFVPILGIVAAVILLVIFVVMGPALILASLVEPKHLYNLRKWKGDINQIYDLSRRDDAVETVYDKIIELARKQPEYPIYGGITPT